MGNGAGVALRMTITIKANGGTPQARESIMHPQPGTG